MPTLIFFPWISVTDTVDIGRFRFTRYERGERTWPDDVHRIVGAYERMPGRPVEKATLVALDGTVGGELPDSAIEEVFDLRRAVSFAGLRYRRFFHHDGYLNDHTFACVIQNYQPGQTSVGVTARRRDGDSRKLWTDGFHVPCPDHVSAETKVRIDAGLVGALQAGMRGGQGDALRDAIELFNLANTDSVDIRPHTEILLSVAATQRMLGVTKKSKGKLIARRFAEALSSIPPERTVSDCRRAIQPAPNAATLRELWFEDFYAIRGAVAHGRPDGPPSSVWTLAEHLLLSSYIIPRLTLLRLAGAGLYSLTERGRTEIADFDHLLCQSNLLGPPDAAEGDPAPEEFHRASGPWAWSEALFSAQSELHIRKYAPELERVLSELMSDDGRTEPENAAGTSDSEGSA